MTVTIGCYHAHYSNIDYIRQAMEPYDVELVHFVDPGLDRRKTDADFPLERVQARIAETIAWVGSSHVDAVLVTCTFFTAHMDDRGGGLLPVPIVKIDDPLFEAICECPRPPMLVFTNPATVRGTLDRLADYARAKGKPLAFQPRLLEGTFELLMQGKKEAYTDIVAEGLGALAMEHPELQVWAAQLSMAAAAEKAEREATVHIGAPLSVLVRHMAKRLRLQPRP